MSYEGREIKICENGHLSFEDCYYPVGEPRLCHCEAKIIWERSIDDTNCEAYGNFPLEFFKVKAPAIVEECPTCHHIKVIEEALYEIPICYQCKSYNIRSSRFYLGETFVGDIKCEDCGTVLFSEPLTP